MALVLTEVMIIKQDRRLRWYPRHNAPSPGVVFIANHPLVRLHFSSDVARYAFARYFIYIQMQQFIRDIQHPEILDLGDMIERYMCSSYREIAEEMEA